MKYFIDTEFIEGFHKPYFGKRRHHIDLISIGIVAEDGREYYAISNEYRYKAASDWVKENVINSIYREQVPSFKQQFMDISTFHKYIPTAKSNRQIAKEIIDFINGEPIKIHKSINMVQLDIESERTMRRGYLQPEFYGYYSDYDWVLFCSLFGTMMDLPKGFPMFCMDLKQTLDEKIQRVYFSKRWELGIISGMGHELPLHEKIKKVTQHSTYPKQENEHNALADARWNKKLYEFLQTL